MENRHTRIINRLIEMYPDARCELDHGSAYELLVATILSAQSTDRQVNIVTGKLFSNYNTPQQMVALKEEELGALIQSIGFYNTKAKNILRMSKILLDEFGGEVPSTMEELIQLPGVGRKTANVVMSNAFQIPAFAVDTHVMRVTQRLGLTKHQTPDEIEKDITSQLAPELYILAHHALIFHGRRMCKARNPLCGQCSLQEECQYYTTK